MGQFEQVLYGSYEPDQARVPCDSDAHLADGDGGYRHAVDCTRLTPDGQAYTIRNMRTLRPKTEAIFFRCTKQDKADIEAEAKASKYDSVSDFLRDTIRKSLDSRPSRAHSARTR